MKHPLYTPLVKCQVGSQDSNCCGQGLGSDPNAALIPKFITSIKLMQKPSAKGLLKAYQECTELWRREIWVRGNMPSFSAA